MPFTNQAPCSPEQDGSHWMTQPGTSNAQYAQPDRSKTDNGIFPVLSVPFSANIIAMLGCATVVFFIYLYSTIIVLFYILVLVLVTLLRAFVIFISFFFI